MLSDGESAGTSRQGDKAQSRSSAVLGKARSSLKICSAQVLAVECYLIC